MKRITKESQSDSFRKFRDHDKLGVCVVFNFKAGYRIMRHGLYKDHGKLPVIYLPDRIKRLQNQGIKPNVSVQIAKDFLALKKPPEVKSPNPEKLREKTISKQGLKAAQKALRVRLDEMGMDLDKL